MGYKFQLSLGHCDYLLDQASTDLRFNVGYPRAQALISIA